MNVSQQTETAQGITKKGCDLSNRGARVSHNHSSDRRMREEIHGCCKYSRGLPYGGHGQGGNYCALRESDRGNGEDLSDYIPNVCEDREWADRGVCEAV